MQKNRTDINYLIFLLLVIFIVQVWTSGCITKDKVSVAKLPNCQDTYYKDDARCQVSWFKITVDEAGLIDAEYFDERELDDVEF
jgi:hypothetical protein